MNPALISSFRFHRQKKHNAAHSLALARADIANDKKRYPASAGWNPPFEAHGSKLFRWIEKPSSCGLRFVGYADKIAALSHTGWYVNNDQSETVRGVVFQLPGRDGKPQFVAGYEDWNNGKAENDGPCCLDFGDIIEGEAPEFVKPSNGYPGYWTWTYSATEHDGARDAAKRADSIAERLAESEREYQAAWEAGRMYADLGNEIASERRAIMATLSERRAAKHDAANYPAICETLRRAISAGLERIAEKRSTRSKLIEGDYVAEWIPGFFSGDAALVAAFKEGTND